MTPSPTRRIVRSLPWCAGALLLAGCDRTAPPPGPPVQPALHAVLLPGDPPTFAKQLATGLAFEALPAASVMLRLSSPMPATVAATSVTLTPRGGTAATPLRHVRRDDVTTKRQLADSGYFEAVADAFAYTIVVTPPAPERTGAGFDLHVRNVAPGAGADSVGAPLVVSVLPRSTQVRASEVAYDCGVDRDFRYHNCKRGSAVVAHDFTLEGWLVESRANRFGGMPEDQHYYFVPNVDFIDAIYGPRGTLAALTGASPYATVRTRGNPAQPPAGQLPLHDVDLAGRSRGFTINSLVLPFNIHYDTAQQEPDALTVIKTEVNAWYVADNAFDNRTYVSRGPAPAGWRSAVPPAGVDTGHGWSKTRWPYDPFRPDDGITTLVPGDYVRVNGALYIDESHDGTGVTSAWERAVPGHGGWMEIHPVDWIKRVPAPALRKTPVMVNLIGATPRAMGATSTVRFAPELQPGSGAVLRCRELIDGRFTRAGVTHTVAIDDAGVTVTMRLTTPGGRFQASYVVWWEPGAARDTTCA